MESKTETVSDNKLIDRFMGLKELSEEEKVMPHNKYHIPLGYIPYDRDWNLLMSVVEKISELDCVYHWTLTEGTFSINADITFENLGEGIAKVYVTVVQFIRWFNSQSPATIK